jgi:hypothetical protein
VSAFVVDTQRILAELIVVRLEPNGTNGADARSYTLPRTLDVGHRQKEDTDYDTV